MHRRPSALLAALAALMLVLTACAGGGAPSGGPFPSVSGAFGERPTLEFPEDGPPSELETFVLEEGQGREVEVGDLLLVDYLGQIWGGAIFDNSYDRGTPFNLVIGLGGVIDGWDQGLVGQSVGSRVLLVIPPDLGYGEAGNEGAGIKGTDTLAFVVDIIGAYGPRSAADADASPTGAADQVGPVVEGDLGGPATISVPDGATEPEEIITTVLAEASGELVQAGGVVVHYAGTLWDNSEGQSTWEQGRPTIVAAGEGGAFGDLVGIPIGSRVLIELPMTEEFQAVAVVVDILAQTTVS